MSIILLKSITPGYNASGDAEWGLISGTLSSQTDLQSELDAKINTNEKSVANGVASLDAGVKVPSLELDISTGTDVANGTANKLLDASKVLDEDTMASNSDQHTVTQQSVVSYVQSEVSGGTTYRGLVTSPADITGSSTGNSYIDGTTNYEIGDMFTISSVGETLITVSDGTIPVSNGTALIINKNVAKASILVADVDVIRTSALVSSVFGRAGAVVATSGDYTASQVTNTPSGGISSTEVQAALNELDSEKVSTSLVDAKGDILVATADNTITRLPVGTDGQVLQADSTQPSGLKYADIAGERKHALLYVSSNFSLNNGLPTNCINWAILTSTITGLTVSGASNDIINLPAGYVYELSFCPDNGSMNATEYAEYVFRDSTDTEYASQNTGIVASGADINGSSTLHMILDATGGAESLHVRFTDIFAVVTTIQVRGESDTTSRRKTSLFITTL